MSGSLNTLHKMKIGEISLVDDPCDPEAVVEIVKLRPGAGQEGGNVMTLEELTKRLGEVEGEITTLTKAKDAAEARVTTLEGEVNVQKARADKAEADLTAAQETIEKAKPAETTDYADGITDTVLKSLPAAAREAIEKARKVADETETATFIAKAKSLGFGKPDELGPMLQRIAKGKSTADDAGKIETILKTAAQGFSPLFKQLGSDVKVEGNPVEIVKGKVADLRKEKPDLTAEAAEVEVLTAHPELYDAYVLEKRRASAGLAD